MTEVSISFEGLQVAVVENRIMDLEWLCGTLENIGCHIIWKTDNWTDAHKEAQTALPAVVFVDLRLLKGTSANDHEMGWNLIRDLRGINPHLAIIICSGAPVIDDIILEAIRMGCSYIIKEDLTWQQSTNVLGAAILAALSNSVFLTNEAADGVNVAISRVKNSNILSYRELTVLELTAEGLRNADIADRLFIAEATVKTHIRNILAKLEVRNRTEAADWYRQHFG